jgi:hypothetical protein
MASNARWSPRPARRINRASDSRGLGIQADAEVAAEAVSLADIVGIIDSPAPNRKLH